MLRQRLRTELRTARLERGMTQEQAARALDWSLSKLIRIESTRVAITTTDLKALLWLYGIIDKEQVDDLIALARASREIPWWRHYRDIASPQLLDLLDYENAASHISQFDATFVPGILQTEEYALAVLQFFFEETYASKDVADLVDLRIRRKDLLFSKYAPKFSFIVDESIVHRLVGSPSIMSWQLEHLVTVADLPNVTMQVVPYTAGLHPGVKGSFEIVQFDDEREEKVVYLEDSRGDFISDDPISTQGYLTAFERIEEVSLTPLDSVDYLLRAIGEMT
jgi:transcriptional regulator with XRE-family HTH domain